jgi:hypothetical protein
MLGLLLRWKFSDRDLRQR